MSAVNETSPRQTTITVATTYELCADHKAMLRALVQKITGRADVSGELVLNLSQGGIGRAKLSEQTETLQIPK